MANTQAQTYLNDQDYVTISAIVPNYWDQTQNKNIDLRVYLEATTSGIKTQRQVTDGCLWQLIANADGYALKNVATDLYLGVYTRDNNNFTLNLQAQQTFFRVNATEGADREWLRGTIYYQYLLAHNGWTETVKVMVGRAYNEPYNFIASRYNAYQTVEIERWEQKGGGGSASSHFNPNKVVFGYAGDDAPANGTPQAVKFVLDASSQSYFQCVCREEMLIGRQTNAMDPSKVTDVNVYWLSTGNQKGKLSQLVRSDFTATAETADRTLMTLSGASKVGDDWQFSITPNGKSPMGLKQREYEENVGGTTVGVEKWVDHVDDVIAEYTYDGTTYRDTMRVVRKSYHEEQLPTLTFTINPVTYTFKQAGETKDFSVVATHQHGKAIYNSDNQMEGDPVYESGYEPAPVTFTGSNLTLNLSDDWGEELTATINGDHGIRVTAKANNKNTLRLADLTGTLCPVKETSHPCESFTITLRQRYDDAGIQLIPNVGKGNTALRINQYGREEQAVHTAERTIYYDDQEAIELRLPESGYSGYMRWYDYETNGAPNYNHCHDRISTEWDLAPRSESGAAFAAINTPADKDATDKEGYSLGHYALNKSAKGSDGNTLTAAILNEDQNNNPAPRIRPWSDKGYHTMACDVSAYTDYEITVENRQIKSIKEPTLSYRQLFHMRPASDMAERFENLKDGEFLESYSYQAPAGKVVYLSTEYRFNKYRSHISEMCYFYYDKNGVIQRITDKTPVVWTEYTLQNNGTYGNERTFTPSYSSTMDYVRVQEDNYPVQKKYTLTVPAANANTNKDLLIACFEVKFLDIEQYGPTPNVIITQQRIETDYKLLKNINFDNYDSHLPWDYTSYGYVYDVAPLNTDAGFKRGASQGVFPFYGEYTVVESVNKDWANSAAHSGKALYVDGTMEPGLVATISAETNICSGQTVYCSAWFRNPRPNNNWAANGNTANPIFRCNIQGRNGDGEWEDAGVYFVGELLIGSPWQQVVFPIEAAHSYDETRVSIYNFATTNQGNDFMVDDINLFVSLLPIASYQGKMACRSNDSEATRAAAILRLDYTNINAGDARYMYYQIYNETMDKPVNLTDAVAYFHEAPGMQDNSDHGSVGVPDVTFDPEAYNLQQKAEGKDTLKIYYSVSKLLDDMVANNWQHAKAYIKTDNSAVGKENTTGMTKWLLYVAHLVDQVTSAELDNTTIQTIPLQKLFDEHAYVMRMAYTPVELEDADCNLTTPIHATQRTVFTLRNSSKKTIMHTPDVNGVMTADFEGKEKYIHKQSYGNCPNDLYFLTPTVVNNLAVEGVGGQTKDIVAPIYADWLIGDPKGDVLSETPPPPTSDSYQDYLNRLQESINGFQATYGGYTHGQVSHAIMYDMRRVPTDKEPNPNYAAKSFEELDPYAFESLQNYEIIRYLHDNEWLHMYDTAIHFYLGSKDTARYWCFPIENTAKAKVKVTENDTQQEKEIILKDCNEPHRIMVTSAESDYHVNVTPIAQQDKTPQQKLLLPSVKVLDNESNNITTVTIPIKEIADNVNISDSKPGADITIDLLAEMPNYISFVDLETGKPIDKPSTFMVGEEYTMRLAYQKDNNAYWMGAEETSCRVGYIFFTMQIVPNVLVWQNDDATFNGWGRDENWKGWIDHNKDGQIQSGELTNGFVPMEGSNVVIPELNNPLLYPYIAPEHEHDHYPMAIHHEQHKCKNIYFAPGARISNQHLLEYERAYVDMQITAGKWNMMSAPLQKMVSGDMFIPHTGKYNVSGAGRIPEPNPFEVNSFQGLRHRDAAYLFYQHFYNETVDSYYEDGSSSSAVSIGFEESNSLSQALQPGGGYSLYGVGMEGKETLTIRLPKPDTQYQYYTSTGDPSGQFATVDRGADDESYKFAFMADHDHPDMQITLTNDIASQNFLFGNPTMAYIDMQLFLDANKTVLNPIFHRIESSTWTASTELTMIQDRYLAPMSSVMLETKDQIATTNITVNLSASHLTLNNMIGSPRDMQPETPQRNIAQSPSRAIDSEILTIYAFTPKAAARTVLAANPMANDRYEVGEDAIFVSSGVENSTSVKSPLNMYTVAEQVPMMADVRQGISRIPLAFLVDAKTRTETMQLAFYTTSNWQRECYFVDHKTGQKIRIMDGLVISVEMPQNHEQRYFIEGPDDYNAGTDPGTGDDTGTAVEQVLTPNAAHKMWAYAPDRNNIIISASDVMKSVTLYDITGRALATLQPDLLSTQLTMQATVQSGVYIVAVTFRDNTTAQTQIIVQ